MYHSLIDEIRPENPNQMINFSYTLRFVEILTQYFSICLDLGRICR